MTPEINSLFSNLLTLAQSNKWDIIKKKLSFVSKTNNSSIAEAILKIKNVYTGDSICHLATLNNQIGILEILHSLGIDLRVQNYFNQSPLELVKAKLENNELRADQVPIECIEFLLNNVYSPVEKLFYGPNDIDTMIRIFNENPEAINEPLDCYNKMTWVCVCAEECRLEELKWLYIHGANFHVSDGFGNKLLHMVSVPPLESDDDDFEDSDSDDQDSVCCSEYYSLPRTTAPPTPKSCTLNNKLLPVRSFTDAQIRSKKSLHDYFYQLEATSNFTELERKSADVFIFLLSLQIFNINDTNFSNSTPCHIIAEKSEINPNFAYAVIQLFYHCNADLNLCDDEGANVAMVLAANIGDGPWLTWCITEQSRHGGGCDLNHEDTRGRKLEDYVVKAYMDALDSEFENNRVN